MTQPTKVKYHLKVIHSRGGIEGKKKGMQLPEFSMEEQCCE